MKDDSVRHTKTTQGRGWANGSTPTILGGLCKIQPEKGPDSPLFVTRDREGYVVGYIYIVITIYVSLNYSPRLKIRLHNQGYTSGCSLENFIRARIKFVGGCGIWSKLA